MGGWGAGAGVGRGTLHITRSCNFESCPVDCSLSLLYSSRDSMTAGDFTVFGADIPPQEVLLNEVNIQTG
jgi:hypothetical protein